MYYTKAYIHPWRERWFNIVWELPYWRARCWWSRLYNWFRVCSLPRERQECCSRDRPGRNCKLVLAILLVPLRIGWTRMLITLMLYSWVVANCMLLSQNSERLSRNNKRMLVALGMISQRKLTSFLFVTKPCLVSKKNVSQLKKITNYTV